VSNFGDAVFIRVAPFFGIKKWARFITFDLDLMPSCLSGGAENADCNGLAYLPSRCGKQGLNF
jgi:hypothetical protein